MHLILDPGAVIAEQERLHIFVSFERKHALTLNPWKVELLQGHCSFTWRELTNLNYLLSSCTYRGSSSPYGVWRCQKAEEERLPSDSVRSTS